MIEGEEEIIMQTPKRATRLARLSRFGRQVLVSAALAATALTASIAAQDGPPKLNVAPSCGAVARFSVAAGRNDEACMADERIAQDAVTKNWSKYPPADKTLCVGMNKTGGAASYVELQSCVEIMRDAREIHLGLGEPLLDKGELKTRSLLPTDLDEGSLFAGGNSKAHRRHKRKQPTASVQ
jgi:hypothetical protein